MRLRAVEFKVPCAMSLNSEEKQRGKGVPTWVEFQKTEQKQNATSVYSRNKKACFLIWTLSCGLYIILYRGVEKGVEWDRKGISFFKKKHILMNYIYIIHLVYEYTLSFYSYTF